MEIVVIKSGPESDFCLASIPFVMAPASYFNSTAYVAFKTAHI